MVTHRPGTRTSGLLAACCRCRRRDLIPGDQIVEALRRASGRMSLIRAARMTSQ